VVGTTLAPRLIRRTTSADRDALNAPSSRRRKKVIEPTSWYGRRANVGRTTTGWACSLYIDYTYDIKHLIILISIVYK